MNSEERKKKFIILLKELLERDCNSVQARLAKKLNVGTSRLSRWLSGQTDPLNLDALVFSRLAGLRGCSTEDLANNLGFIAPHQSSRNKFRLLLEEMLSNKTQEELGKNLGVSQIAISNWLNPEKNIDPGNISAGTMFAIAHQKGWTFDKLLTYLGLQPEDRSEIITTKRDRTLCIILEQEDLSLASLYSSNLAVHLQLQPENIKIATHHSIPESLEGFHILIIDINSPQSPSIPLLNSLEFEGDILVFAARSLPDDVRNRLNQKSTELILKPVPWSGLKDKSYFLE